MTARYTEKKIAVTEGNENKRIGNVVEIETADLNDASIIWIPEDSVKLIPKVIHKEGVYEASDDVGHPTGYSSVEIVLPDTSGVEKVGTKAITHNGEYYAKDESDSPVFAFSTVVVNVEGLD